MDRRATELRKLSIGGEAVPIRSADLIERVRQAPGGAVRTSWEVIAIAGVAWHRTGDQSIEFEGRDGTAYQGSGGVHASITANANGVVSTIVVTGSNELKRA